MNPYIKDLMWRPVTKPPKRTLSKKCLDVFKMKYPELEKGKEIQLDLMQNSQLVEALRIFGLDEDAKTLEDAFDRNGSIILYLGHDE